MLDIDSMENILPVADEHGDESSGNEYIKFKPCNVSALQRTQLLGENASSILSQSREPMSRHKYINGNIEQYI
jgi:hypothetical protein